MPSCVAEVLIDRPQFPQPVVDAIKTFRDSKPFRGTYEERCEKFADVVSRLNEALDMDVVVHFTGVESETSTNSRVARGEDGRPTIVMDGKLSAITLLYLYAGCMGESDPAMLEHWGRMRWAANLFKRFFPRSFAGCRTDGLFLVRA